MNIKYLVDTNVWLERLLDQEKSQICGKFFDVVPVETISISDFSLHSIGVILARNKKIETFKTFVSDILINSGILQLTLQSIDLISLSSVINRYNLDFDDAYQLTLSQKYDLTLITYDKDFIFLENKKTPDEVLEGI